MTQSPTGTMFMLQQVECYKKNLSRALETTAMSKIAKLGEALRDAGRLGQIVYLCGNGGSAGNAMQRVEVNQVVCSPGVLASLQDRLLFFCAGITRSASELLLMRYLYPTEIEAFAADSGPRVIASEEFLSDASPAASTWSVGYLLRK